MHITTKALVLRSVDYKESDKILTLLTAEMGKVTASARGCRKKGSPIAAGCQLLCWAEMVLYEYQGRWVVKEAVTEREFRGVREDLEKLALAADCQMIDCPVSGGTAGAKAGTLTLMAACSDEVFDRCKPVLECFGTNVKHVGTQVGQGQAIKAINQLLVGVHMCATAEAFTLAAKCGLDLQMMYDTICTSAGRSEIFRNRGQYLIDRNFDTRSTLQIQLKDADIVCKTADRVGAPIPLTNTVRELFKLAVRKYPPTDDSLEVVRLYEELCSP